MLEGLPGPLSPWCGDGVSAPTVDAHLTTDEDGFRIDFDEGFGASNAHVHRGGLNDSEPESCFGEFDDQGERRLFPG